MCAAVNAASASACADSAAFTCSASSLARASFAGRSSADAEPTLLLAVFCSARSESATEIAARRSVSAVSKRIYQRRVFATAELGPAYGVGVLPEQLQVDHGRKTTFDAPVRSHQMAESAPTTVP